MSNTCKHLEQACLHCYRLRSRHGRISLAWSWWVYLGLDDRKALYKSWLDVAAREKIFILVPEEVISPDDKLGWNDRRGDIMTNPSSDENGGHMSFRLAIDAGEKSYQPPTPLSSGRMSTKTRRRLRLKLFRTSTRKMNRQSFKPAIAARPMLRMSSL